MVKLLKLITGCPLNSNQINYKKMTNFSVKNEKKSPPKCPKNTVKSKLKINYYPNIRSTVHLCTS